MDKSSTGFDQPSFPQRSPPCHFNFAQRIAVVACLFQCQVFDDEAVPEQSGMPVLRCKTHMSISMYFSVRLIILLGVVWEVGNLKRSTAVFDVQDEVLVKHAFDSFKEELGTDSSSRVLDEESFQQLLSHLSRIARKRPSNMQLEAKRDDLQVTSVISISSLVHWHPFAWGLVRSYTRLFSSFVQAVLVSTLDR